MMYMIYMIYMIYMMYMIYMIYFEVHDIRDIHDLDRNLSQVRSGLSSRPSSTLGRVTLRLCSLQTPECAAMPH